jgi:hypothetical protein
LSDNIGAHSFSYIDPYPCPYGRVHNLCSFAIKAGDNPDIEVAKKLMPGAQYEGMVIDQYPVDGEMFGVTDRSFSHQPMRFPEFVYKCGLVAGRSLFLTEIGTYPGEDIDLKLAAIGGLRMLYRRRFDDTGWEQLRAAPAAKIPATERLWLRARYYWNRRPVWQFRTPVDV